MSTTIDLPLAADRPALRTARERSERLQGVFVIALLAAGAWQGIAALATPAAQRRLAPVLTLPALLDGRTAAAVNFVQAHYLPADHFLRAAGGVLRWRFFGSGGPQVAVGCDDWLYLTEEAQTFSDAGANLAARADITAAVSAALARRGIELIVAVVPDKGRIEGATRCAAPRSAQAERRYDTFQALLRGRGVPTVDLARPFHAARAIGAVYYRTDTHWNQEGAAFAARAIADVVRTQLDGGHAYRTERASVTSDGPGDLLRLMSLDLVPDTVLGLGLRPAPDKQFAERTVETVRPPEADDLLATGPGDQVVLLGSSYSVNANFHGRLQEALSAPVNNVAEAGGGFAGSASAYFRSTTFADTPPRLIIWEMPERTLTKTLDDADRGLSEIR